MGTNYSLFQEVLNEDCKANIYFLDKQDRFIHLNWSQAYILINKISIVLKKIMGLKNPCFGLYHNEAFIWDLCNFALKLNGFALLGLNHYDNYQNTGELVRAIPIDGIICSSSQLVIVRQFWKGLIVLVDINEDHELLISVDESLSIFTPSIPQNSNEICEILCSSGSTGSPKHYSFTAEQILMACEMIRDFYRNELEAIEKTISWMPLANPFQRILNLVSIQANKTIYYINDPRKIIEYSKRVEVEYLASIPRFYEKIYENIKEGFFGITPLRPIFRYVFNKLTQGKLSSTDKIKLVGIPYIIQFLIKKNVSKKLTFLISGSALLPNWLDNFFNNIQLPIFQAYGMSENIIPISMSNSKDKKIGSVGKVLSLNQVRIKNGQIYIKSPGLNLEFLDNCSDEYYATGDYGFIDDEGFVYIQGRESDFFKLSTGKRIYPNPIENSLKQLSYVNYVCIIGEGYKYPVAIIDVQNNFNNKFSNTDLLTREIINLTKNFNAYEVPKLILIITNLFSIETGELTPNLKMRRKQIIKNYAHRIQPLLERKTDYRLIQVEYF